MLFYDEICDMIIGDMEGCLQSTSIVVQADLLNRCINLATRTSGFYIQTGIAGTLSM